MGRRSWLESLLTNEVLPMIATDNAEGRTAAQHWATQLRELWAQRGFTELSQQQSLMDLTRRAIKDQLGEDHFSLTFISFTSEEQVELNNHKQDRVAKRNENVQHLDNPEEIVAQALKLLDSLEWAEIAAGLALLTGRRSSELLSTAQFVPKSAWSVTFTGALKRRGESQALSFEIPTLAPAERVCEALGKIRQALPEASQMTARAINSKFGPAVARACDEHFLHLVPPREGEETLYTHLFRAIYPTIATFWYAPVQVNATEFKAAIQGHYAILDAKNPKLRRDLSASRHYSDYDIADSVIAQHNGQRQGVKLGYEGIQPIEVFEAAWKPRGASVEADETTEAPPLLGITRKQTTTLRIWQTDKPRWLAILERIGTTEGRQQDRLAHFLSWLEELYDQLSDGIQEQTETTPSTPEQTTPFVPEPVAEPPAQDKPLEAIPMQSQNEVDAPSRLEVRIDKLVDKMTQFLEWQMQISVPTARTVRANKPKPQTSEPDASEQTASPPTTRPRAAVSDTTNRVNQAIDAIIAYNHTPERRHDDKWAIGISTLKAFVSSQEAIVTLIGGKNRKGLQVTGTRQEEIDKHHKEHQIDPTTHNYRHRGKSKINELIQID